MYQEKRKGQIIRLMYPRLCEKQLSKDCILKNYILKNRAENSLKTYERQKIIVADFIKKKKKNSSITLIHLLLKITRIFGKQ